MQSHRCVHVEVPLHPKVAHVTAPKHLCPIALIPVLRNFVGGLVLRKTDNVLQDSGIWQVAYKSEYQVADVSLLVNLIGQKCMKWSLPLVFG